MTAALPAPSHDKPRLLLIDKPDSTQTYFTIMMPGVQRGHPDRTGLRLVNSLFGERFTSMLNQALNYIDDQTDVVAPHPSS